jgi:large subunit ribosomal protein LP1
MASAQQACVYAAFILDGGDSASIQKVCKAAGIDVPASLADTFGKTFASQKLGDLVKNVSFGGGGAAAGAAAPAAAKADDKKAAAAPAKDDKKAKKEEKPADEDDDLFGGGLF